MNYSGWGFVAVIMVAQLGIGPLSEAGAVTWSVKTNTNTTVCSGSASPTANLPATCGTDLQFVASGGAAKIEAIDTPTNDILQLLNTKIVALRNLTDYVLTFEHTFTPGPTLSDFNPFYYRTHMYGTYISGPLPANKIAVTSTVEHPVGTSLLAAAPQAAPPPQLNFNYLASPYTTTAAMNLDRKIIVKVKFSLENTKYINFGAGRFVKVSSQPFPDTGPGDSGAVSLSELQQILDESGGTACMGLSLPGGDCAGILVTK